MWTAAQKTALKKFKTQTEVDVEIAYLIEMGELHVTRRDAAVFESKTYWAQHDKAVKYFKKAQLLMPM